MEVSHFSLAIAGRIKLAKLPTNLHTCTLLEVSTLANGEAFILEHGINKDLRNVRCILHIYCAVTLNRH